eukprot:3546516-Rhodomonas_salina.1
MFEKPQNSRAEGGSAAGGVEGIAVGKSLALVCELAMAMWPKPHKMAQHPLVYTRSREAWWHGHPAIEANCLHEREPCTEEKLLLLTRPWLDRQL